MKQRSILWQAAGFAAVTFGGTILHFLYDWTGGSILVSPFSGVNESTWEHMKLLFWPMFLFALVQRPFFRGQKSYWCIKLAGILLGLMQIPVLFTPTMEFSENPPTGSTSPYSTSPQRLSFYLNGGHSKKISCHVAVPGFPSSHSV